MPHEEMEWTPRSEILSFEEIERLVRLFASMGVDKLRLTGGEPTTRKGVVDLVERVAKVPGLKSLSMTTNGDALPTLASPLRTAGLTGLNISLDTLKADRFLQITRRDRLDRVLAGIDAAFDAGYPTIKINVVAMADVNDDELCDFIDRFQDRRVEVRFIEFMPFIKNGWQKGRMMPYVEMREKIEQRFELIPLEDEASAVAKTFAVAGAQVRVGFITSMTDDFCGGCNRLRVTADGHLKVCLFGKSGPSLRDAMRSGSTDDEVADLVRVALDHKWAGHPPMNRLVESNDLPMIAIGG
jgi:cyclic pyranopterin phosphate synthase